MVHMKREVVCARERERGGEIDWKVVLHDPSVDFCF
jgi:hypothetical protein